MAKHLAQIILAGAQVIGRAFAKALRQELAASQAAASRAGGGTRGAEHSATNQKLGMTLEEAKQILNVTELSEEQIRKSYEYLFSINDKAAGGSFYIQSKMMKNVLGNLFVPQLSGFGTNHTLRCHLSTLRTLHSDATFIPTWDTVLSDENRRQFLVLSNANKFTLWPKWKTDETIEHSVLIPLCRTDGELGFLYTLRTSTLKDHKWQLSFPGGKVESFDEDFTQTALRETEEEIGLDREKIDIWGMMPPVPMWGGQKLALTLAYIGEVNEKSFTLNRDEVECIYVLTLKHLCNKKNFSTTQFRSPFGKKVFSMPVYIGCKPVLWGVTAVVTHMTLSSLLPHLYNHELHHIEPLK